VVRLDSLEFKAPELSIIFLIPVKITNIHGKFEDFEKFLEKIRSNTNSIVQYYIPIDVKERNLYNTLTEDLRIFYDSDIEYFDDEYLRLRRFCRIDLEDFNLQILLKDISKTVKIKPYVTIFDVGIAIYTFWIQGLSDLRKEEIIDLCFLNKIKIKKNGKIEILSDFIKNEITKIFGQNKNIIKKDFTENSLVMLFIRDFPFKGGILPEDFIKTYKKQIFDIVTLPERYYGVTYEYHKSRTSQYIDSVLKNISVRNDFPVFLFSNRFLGIKIRTDKPDYGFKKRITFNIVLYTNVILQLKLMKELNNALSDIIKDPKKLSLSRLVKLRQAIYEDLEEYINTRIQRYEIWKIAMEDAAEQLGIPALYAAVKERLDMLNMYIQSAYQLHSNILFIILNTFAILSAIIALISFMSQALTGTALAIILTTIVLWIAIVYNYFAPYIR